MTLKVSLPDVEVKDLARIREAFEKGWNVIVWNDHINLMNYVVFVFQRVFGFGEVKARQHMLEVHHQGKSCLTTETREKAELYWQRLQQFGLRTTLEKVE